MSFESAYNNPKFSDIKIQLADGRLINAHRVILANESKMMAIMFESTDDENTIMLDKFPAAITENIIRSFYIDALVVPTESDPWVLTLKAAAYYMAENLISALCSRIPDNISAENLLTFGFEYDLDILLETAISTKMPMDSIMIANIMRPFDVKKKIQFLLLCDQYMTDYEFLKIAANMLDIIPYEILSRANIKRITPSELRELKDLPTIKNDKMLMHFLDTQLNPIVPKAIKKVAIRKPIGPVKLQQNLIQTTYYNHFDYISGDDSSDSGT